MDLFFVALSLSMYGVAKASFLSDASIYNCFIQDRNGTFTHSCPMDFSAAPCYNESIEQSSFQAGVLRLPIFYICRKLSVAPSISVLIPRPLINWKKIRRAALVWMRFFVLVLHRLPPFRDVPTGFPGAAQGGSDP